MLPDPEHLAEICIAAVRTATAPLLARIQLLEQRAPRDGERGEKGDPGKDADPSEVLALKAEVASLRSRLEGLPSLEPEVVREIARAEASEQQAAWDGRIESLVLKAVAEIPVPKDGQPGQSVDPEAVDAMVARHVSKAFSDLTLPKDGESVTVDDVAPMLEALVEKAVAARPLPRDGVSVVGVLVDRDGHLIHTFSDGSTKDVGSVVGRDADPIVMARMVAEEVAKIPRPKDGRDGTLENLKAVQVDERTMRLCLKDGTLVEGGEIVFAHPLDRGVWRDTGVYVKGDGVSFGGSFFIAQRNDPGKPEVGDGWRLAVKRGRDGQAGPKAK